MWTARVRRWLEGWRSTSPARGQSGCDGLVRLGREVHRGTGGIGESTGCLATSTSAVEWRMVRSQGRDEKIGGGVEGVGWVGLVRARWVNGEVNHRIREDGHRAHDGKIERRPSRLAARVTQWASRGCAGGRLTFHWAASALGFSTQQVQRVCVGWRWRRVDDLTPKEWSGASLIGFSDCLFSRQIAGWVGFGFGGWEIRGWVGLVSFPLIFAVWVGMGCGIQVKLRGDQPNPYLWFHTGFDAEFGGFGMGWVGFQDGMGFRGRRIHT